MFKHSYQTSYLIFIFSCESKWKQNKYIKTNIRVEIWKLKQLLNKSFTHFNIIIFFNSIKKNHPKTPCQSMSQQALTCFTNSQLKWESNFETREHNLKSLNSPNGKVILWGSHHSLAIVLWWNSLILDEVTKDFETLVPRTCWTTGFIYRKSLGTDLFGTLPSSFSLLYASLMWQGLIGPVSFLSVITTRAAN